jgi:hypothetical protein
MRAARSNRSIAKPEGWSMLMPKKANGANFKVSGGELTVTFDSGGPSLTYVVCVWGPKPQFGGQRPKVWCSETATREDGTAEVTVPGGMAATGAQVTWSGGLVAGGEEQGRLLVTLEEGGGESISYAYEYAFSGKDQTQTFYDGLNFT